MKKIIALEYDKELLPSIGDSMCFDSGFVAISARVLNGKDMYDVVIKATGHVKVLYGEEVYKCASLMPDALRKMFIDGSINEAAGKEVEICENNWWETYIYKNGENKDAFYFEGVPSDFKNEEEIEQYVLETLESYFNSED